MNIPQDILEQATEFVFEAWVKKEGYKLHYGSTPGWGIYYSDEKDKAHKMPKITRDMIEELLEERDLAPFLKN